MPSFIIKNTECVSAGVVFYRMDKGPQFMLQQKIDNRRKCVLFEDFGGKSDPEDTSIEMVAAREAAEESNGEIQEYDDIKFETYEDKVAESARYIYSLIKLYSTKTLVNRRNKYALFLVKMPHQIKFDMLNFGEKEIHPKWDIWRTIDWFSSRELLTNGILHPRIRHMTRLLCC